jgi:hypothetical protein
MGSFQACLAEGRFPKDTSGKRRLFPVALRNSDGLRFMPAVRGTEAA